MTWHEVAIPVMFFLVLGIVAIVWILARHRERITIVEKGLTSEDIKSLYSAGFRRRDPLTSLKWGLLLVLAGVAVMLGTFLQKEFHVDEGVIFGMVCLFVGIGLVAFYTIASKKMREQSNGTEIRQV